MKINLQDLINIPAGQVYQIPSQLNNNFLVFEGFAAPASLSLPFQQKVRPSGEGTLGEFVYITNNGDATAKPNLVIMPSDISLPFVSVGNGLADVDIYTIPYGETVLVYRTQQESTEIYIKKIDGNGDKNPEADGHFKNIKVDKSTTTNSLQAVKADVSQKLTAESLTSRSLIEATTNSATKVPRINITMYDSNSDIPDGNVAPTAFGNKSAYMQIGGMEKGKDSYRLLGFGCTDGIKEPPAFFGFKETDNTKETSGNFIFSMRSNSENSAETNEILLKNDGNIEVPVQDITVIGDNDLVTKKALTSYFETEMKDDDLQVKSLGVLTDSNFEGKAVFKDSVDMKDLTVEGTLTAKNMTLPDDLTLKNLTVSGDLTAPNFKFPETATFKDVKVTGNITANTASFSGKITSEADIENKGTLTTAELNVVGQSIVAEINASEIVTNTIEATESVHSKDIFADGAFSSPNISDTDKGLVLGAISGKQIELVPDTLIKNNLTVGDSLTVTKRLEAATITGIKSGEATLPINVAADINLNSNSTFNGNSAFNGDVSFAKKISIKDIDFTGDLEVKGKLSVDSESTFNKKLTANKGIAVSTIDGVQGALGEDAVVVKADILFNKSASFNGDVSFANKVSLKDIDLKGKLEVEGDFIADSDGTFNKDLTVKGNINSTGAFKPASIDTTSIKAKNIFGEEVVIKRPVGKLNPYFRLSDTLVDTKDDPKEYQFISNLKREDPCDGGFPEGSMKFGSRTASSRWDIYQCPTKPYFTLLQQEFVTRYNYAPDLFEYTASMCQVKNTLKAEKVVTTGLDVSSELNISSNSNFDPYTGVDLNGPANAAFENVKDKLKAPNPLDFPKMSIAQYDPVYSSPTDNTANGKDLSSSIYMQIGGKEYGDGTYKLIGAGFHVSKKNPNPSATKVVGAPNDTDDIMPPVLFGQQEDSHDANGSYGDFVVLTKKKPVSSTETEEVISTTNNPTLAFSVGHDNSISAAEDWNPSKDNHLVTVKYANDMLVKNQQGSQANPFSQLNANEIIMGRFNDQKELPWLYQKIKKTGADFTLINNKTEESAELKLLGDNRLQSGKVYDLVDDGDIVLNKHLKSSNGSKHNRFSNGLIKVTSADQIKANSLVIYTSINDDEFTNRAFIPLSSGFEEGATFSLFVNRLARSNPNDGYSAYITSVGNINAEVIGEGRVDDFIGLGSQSFQFLPFPTFGNVRSVAISVLKTCMINFTCIKMSSAKNDHAWLLEITNSGDLSSVIAYSPTGY